MSGGVDSIVPDGDPGESSDENVVAEEKAITSARRKMTAQEREQYMTDGFIGHLRDENSGLSATKECLMTDRNDLREQVRLLRESQKDAEVKCARLERARKSTRVTVGLCSFGGLIGGSLISQFAGNAQEPVLLGVGWGLVGLGGVIAVIQMLVDG